MKCHNEIRAKDALEDLKSVIYQAEELIRRRVHRV